MLCLFGCAGKNLPEVATSAPAGRSSQEHRTLAEIRLTTGTCRNDRVGYGANRIKWVRSYSERPRMIRMLVGNRSTSMVSRVSGCSLCLATVFPEHTQLFLTSSSAKCGKVSRASKGRTHSAPAQCIRWVRWQIARNGQQFQSTRAKPTLCVSLKSQPSVCSCRVEPC